MPYVEGRTVHDADSHIFEPPGTAERQAFYCDNFVDFLGPRVPAAPRP
jgi:hypothetical protein